MHKTMEDKKSQRCYSDNRECRNPFMQFYKTHEYFEDWENRVYRNCRI